LVAIEQYRNGLISLGNMAEFLEISKQEGAEFAELSWD